MNRYQKSKELYARATRVLAGGVSSEFRKFNQPHPLFYKGGCGARITDVDDNSYLDFTLSQGPLLLGHAHPHVLERVERASRDGQLYAGQHLLELELAEKLQRLIPCAERMRFCLSGSEADHLALRLARGFTGKTKFIRFEGHYHGWFDEAIAGVAAGPCDDPAFTPVLRTQGLPPGIHDHVSMLQWNDLAAVEAMFTKHSDDIAAIITEPVMCNHGCIPPEPGFLEGLRALCDHHGALLIFDEVITGFRLGMGGAQRYFEVIPDLAVFGKAMASGYPISVLAGKATVLERVASGAVLLAGTMNSGVPCVAAALATLEVLEREQLHERLFEHGRRLMQGLQDAGRAAGLPLRVQGLGPMFHAGFSPLERTRNYRDTLRFDKTLYGAFVRAMQERNIRLIGRGLWYLSAAHTTADIEEALRHSRDALQSIAQP